MKTNLKLAVVCNDENTDVARTIASATNSVVIDLEELIRDAYSSNNNNNEKKEDNTTITTTTTVQENTFWSERAREAAKTLHKLKHGLTAETMESHLKHVVCLVSEKVKYVRSQGQDWILKNFPTNNDQVRALKREGVNADRIVVATIKKDKEQEEEGETDEIPFDGSREEHIVHLKNLSSEECCVKILRVLERWIDPRDRELQEKTVEVPNAFAVTLFCMDQQHEWRASEFLKPAFEAYPDLQYCLVTLPCTSPESSLLRNFTPVQSESSSHVLYLMRRDAVDARNSLKVERCEKGISAQYIKEVFGEENASKVFRDALDSADEHVYTDLSDHPTISAFVLRCHDRSVGLCVLNSTRTNSKEKIMKLDDTFRLEDVTDLNCHDKNDHSMITHFVLDHVYARQSRFVLQEIMRLCGKSVLYCRIGHDEEETHVPRDMLLRDFVRISLVSFTYIHTYTLIHISGTSTTASHRTTTIKQRYNNVTRCALCATPTCSIGTQDSVQRTYCGCGGI